MKPRSIVGRYEELVRSPHTPTDRVVNGMILIAEEIQELRVAMETPIVDVTAIPWTDIKRCMEVATGKRPRIELTEESAEQVQRWLVDNEPLPE